MKTIAIICDCDNTLAPDTTSSLLEDNGIDLDSFWKDISHQVEMGWDPPIAWMTEIARLIKEGSISQDTNAKLAEFGKSVTAFPGAKEFVPQINESLGKENDVTVEGYVVSCGLESLMKGMPLSESFTDIFGCSFYEKDGVIAGVKSCITFTEKTKFIFAINKGITSKVILSDELTDKKVIIFGVPGAFTPTCSEKHMPSYIKLHKQIIDKGIDAIYCLSVNDDFVMNAWLLSYSDGDKIIGIADGNGDISKNLNLLVDKSKNYMGMRSARFAMIVIDNIIHEIFIEEPGEYQKTSAENLLTKI